MKMIRFFSVLLLVFSLILCMFTVAATPVHAAEPDMDDYLAKALGVTQSDLSNYAANYKNSLPIDYEKNANSCYLAIGGVTASGLKVIDHYSNGYADQIADKLGLEYKVNYFNAIKTDLTSAGAVDYINLRDTSTEIPKADLITFQLDAASFIGSSMSAVADQKDVPWENYISDSSFLAEINTFRNKMTAEYAADYGQKNAESIAIVLEYMLYESVVYSHESLKAVQAIRAKNSNAVILLLGLYNPMRGLTFTANGKTIDISGMVDEMVRVTNAYLLKKTKDLSKIAFVDISAANTNGYSNVTLDINNSKELQSQLVNIKDAEDKQYANQAGHNHIRDQILNAAKAPCKHTNTKTVNKKDATCKVNGYTGDTMCTDCGMLVTKGSDTATAPHNYSAWSQSKAPTCTGTGEETRKCTTCGHAETRSVNAAGHKWDKGTVTTNPTCSTAGTKTFTCNTCKATKTESIATTKHTWNMGVETTPPKCDSEGIKTFTCTACSANMTEPIAMIDHTWDDGEVITKPGCKTEGTKTITCTACKATKSEVVPATDHDWDEGKVTTKPGCETEGVMTTTCNNCGEYSTKAIPATDHHFGEYVSNGDATCQSDGTKTAVCQACDATKTATDPSTRTDHVYEDGVCIFCHAEQPPHTNNAIWWIVGISAAVIILGGGALGFWLYKKKGSIKIVFRRQ